MTCRILVGDARQRLQELPDQSIHCAITSPPYWGQRDYGDHEGMIGTENRWPDHLAALIEVFTEVHRVLRHDGTLWVNYGDSYAFSGRTSGPGEIQNNHRYRHVDSAPRVPMDYTGWDPKELMDLPARLRLALSDHGWLLRSRPIWHKPNAMPESTLDRPTNSHEDLFLMVKRGHQKHYSYDNLAVRQPLRSGPSDIKKMRERQDRLTKIADPDPMVKGHNGRIARKKAVGDPERGGNLRDVWTIATVPYRDAHFATFPPQLAELCIKAGTSERGVCSICGAPHVRIVDKPAMPRGSWHDHRGDGTAGQSQPKNDNQLAGSDFYEQWEPPATLGWEPSCDCGADRVRAVVLDPFGGAGTVGMVADRLGRDSVLVECNPHYAEQSRQRLTDDAPLLADVRVLV